MTGLVAEKTLYDHLVDLGVELDHHESDLYVKASPVVSAIVGRSGLSWSSFRSRLDGSMWIEVPFAYTPWWRARQRP